MYRGDAFPALRGVYLFGDFCSGEVFALRPPADDVEPPGERTEPVVLVGGAGSLVSFGLDEAGEVLVVEHGGAIWRLAAE